ncbi:16S rRNA (guanine(527)-N(7))-methyltransferase RsmG [Candidatus Methylospira mobilis]|uniref:Ribosomal RNA small subunit methyltransferase G n=1 Tax=Candidatus Methylospira mobilis TaxID=1808979 RepID=A0A5Q0BL64_9GAMM|nr:16S rRNA (guanine(527)-N(7))-methyltransferase RsmG [Candidatus Methylospira mobilis]QFY44685.1 16S rRNA (guanine(527)-N(7))-methyltransferase RsmG [Candidatus Methylospira mobilis]WNV05778.1 16S rRNA (guanine(527)-N(7))-methyltransferase RsmG [Candidatus Methylospira mobilis]
MERSALRLAEGLEIMSLSCDRDRQKRLLDFLALLRKWNRVYNLTRITRPDAMVDLHLLDSLAVLPHLSGADVLDVGTGAGLPGIPLAIASPERSFTLLDSNGKKTRFVQQALIELGLKNAVVVQARVEEFAAPAGGGYDTILTRAFASLPEIFEKTKHLLRPGACILALKGQASDEEIRTLTGFSAQIIALDIAGLSAERHLIRIGVQE